MLYWMCERTGNPPTEKQLEHAIKRNFGGLEKLDTYKIFMTHLGNIDFTIPPEVSRKIKKTYYLFIVSRIIICSILTVHHWV